MKKKEKDPEKTDSVFRLSGATTLLDELVPREQYADFYQFPEDREDFRDTIDRKIPSRKSHGRFDDFDG